MSVEGPAQKVWPGHTTCGSQRFVPTSSHPPVVLVEAERRNGGAEGKEVGTDCCFSFSSRRHLKARESCLPFSEGSDKCNHTVKQ